MLSTVFAHSRVFRACIVPVPSASLFAARNSFAQAWTNAQYCTGLPASLTRQKVSRLRQVQALVQSKRMRDHAPSRVVRGVVFDMDGTLTVPCIDFQEMRRRLDIHEGDVLEVIKSRSEEEQKHAYSVLEEIESKALDSMQLMPGADKVAELLDASGVPRGLITRNVLDSVHHFHSKFFSHQPFNPALARCFTPYKPSPAALMHICEQWGIQPEEAVMVGDSAKDDIVSGNAAGAMTVLIDVERKYDLAKLPADQQPDAHVHSMEEVLQILEHKCQLLSADQPASA
eukprot:jgi/Ulvmu1/8356/UM042_0062.1